MYFQLPATGEAFVGLGRGHSTDPASVGPFFGSQAFRGALGSPQDTAGFRSFRGQGVTCPQISMLLVTFLIRTPSPSKKPGLEKWLARVSSAQGHDSRCPSRRPPRGGRSTPTEASPAGVIPTSRPGPTPQMGCTSMAGRL